MTAVEDLTAIVREDMSLVKFSLPSRPLAATVKTSQSSWLMRESWRRFTSDETPSICSAAVLE